MAESTLAHYLAGGEPPRSAIVKIARAVNVSIGWLAAGEESPRAAAAPIDKHQLAISIKQVLEALAAESGGTDPGTIADIVVEYYDDWVRTGRQPSPRRLLSIVPRRR